MVSLCIFSAVFVILLDIFIFSFYVVNDGIGREYPKQFFFNIAPLYRELQIRTVYSTEVTVVAASADPLLFTENIWQSFVLKIRSLSMTGYGI